MAFKVQRADDFGVDRRPVRERRTTEAWSDFGRDRAAPDPLGALEHERLQAGFREKRGGDEPVVAAADDDYVVYR